MVASNTLAGSIARKGLLRDYIAIMIGAFIMAVGLAVFLVDAKVVPGGVSGLSMAVHYLSGSRVPVGLTMWLFNIPLYIWDSWLGKRFGVRTWSASFLKQDRLPVPDPVGGVLLGVGLRIIFKFRGTTAALTSSPRSALGLRPGA
jgi:uncharacterized membrane-anchored protein YitT (DUF2179 family)